MKIEYSKFSDVFHNCSKLLRAACTRWRAIVGGTFHELVFTVFFPDSLKRRPSSAFSACAVTVHATKLFAFV